MELAAVSASGDVLLRTLVKPTFPVSEGARAIHGITDDQLRFAPPIEEVFEQLERVRRGTVLLSYNLGFDWKLLLQSLRAVGQSRAFAALNAGLSEKGCIMLLYAQFHGEPSGVYDGEFAWQKLEVALEQCGIGIEGQPHRGAYGRQRSVERSPTDGSAYPALATVSHPV